MHPEFDQRDINVQQLHRIDAAIKQTTQDEDNQRGWKTSDLYIKVPLGIKPTKAQAKADSSARSTARRRGELDPELADDLPHAKILIQSIRHRDLTQMMIDVCENDDLAKSFHYHGFRETWTPPYGDPESAQPERLFGEMYTSDAFLEAERELLSSAPEPGCDLPRAVVSYMIWSDATHLAQFGQASAWPIYVFFGNLSKYTRACPSSGAAQYAAFIPKVWFSTFMDHILIVS